MSYVLKEIVKGIVLRGESSDITDNVEGSVFQNSTSHRLKTYIESAVREIITSSQAQTLTNKTIDYNSNTILNFPGGSGAGANLDLSNITTTSIPNGVDLESSSTNFRIKTKDQTATFSGNTTLRSGAVQGSYSSGVVYCIPGLNSNAQGATAATKVTGNGLLRSGTITGGTSGSTGDIGIWAGDIFSPSVSGSTGLVEIRSGINDGIGNSGLVSISSGVAAHGDSGTVYIRSGTASSGTSGSILLSTGTAGITKGIIELSAASTQIRSGSSSSVLNVYEQGTGISKDLKVGSITGSNYIHCDMNTNNYPSLYVGGINEIGMASKIGAFASTNINGGEVQFTGSLVKASIDGTYTAGTVVLRSESSYLSESSASNVSVSSGSVNIITRDSYVAGSLTNADTGNIIIQTGVPSGSGVRGSINLNAPEVYVNGNSVVSTENLVIFTDINWGRTGTIFDKNLTTSTAFTFSNLLTGKGITVVVRNTTGSALTVSFPSVQQKAGTIVGSVGANSTNIYEFINSNNIVYCISCITNIV